MYVFASWNSATNLPEFMNRQLSETQQLSLGCGAAPTPEKRSSGTVMSATTPSPKSGKGGAHHQLQAPLLAIADAMRTWQDQFSALKSSIPAKRAAAESDAVFALADELPPPDADLQQFMNAHNIAKWWPQLYGKLGVTSIQELQYLGKANVLLALTGMPIYPVLKLAELAESLPAQSAAKSHAL